MQQLFASVTETDPEQEARRAQEQGALAVRAAELGVQARIAVDAAPFVLTGTVDGRGFYLREQHHLWRVTVAADEDPSSDPWAADPSVPTLDIADGDADRLLIHGRFSVVRALEVAVATVRSFLRQRECGHGPVQPGDRFCPACGAPELP